MIIYSIYILNIKVDQISFITMNIYHLGQCLLTGGSYSSVCFPEYAKRIMGKNYVDGSHSTRVEGIQKENRLRSRSRSEKD